MEYQGKEYKRSELFTKVAKHAHRIDFLDSVPFLNSDFHMILYQYGIMNSFRLRYIANFSFDESNRMHYWEMYNDKSLHDYLFYIDFDFEKESWITKVNPYIRANMNLQDLRLNIFDIESLENFKEQLYDFYMAHIDYLYPKKRPKVYAMRNVYLAFDQDTGQHKIGIANIVNVRLKNLSYQFPKIEFIASWDGTIKDEQALHKLFADYRTTGEWFFLPEDAQTQIDNYFNQKYNESQSA